MDDRDLGAFIHAQRLEALAFILGQRGPVYGHDPRGLFMFEPVQRHTRRPVRSAR